MYKYICVNMTGKFDAERAGIINERVTKGWELICVDNNYAYFKKKKVGSPFVAINKDGHEVILGG